MSCAYRPVVPAPLRDGCPSNRASPNPTAREATLGQHVSPPGRRRHADNAVPTDAFPDCGHTAAEEMAATDSMPAGVRLALNECRFDWCAVAVLDRGFTWYSAAKRWLANQERAYVNGAAR